MFDKICLYLINFNKKNTQKPFSKSQFKAWAPINAKWFLEIQQKD